ncbi:MAG: hypothetical protein WCW44_03405 [archaeon]|jgi:hypothetical protein
MKRITLPARERFATEKLVKGAAIAKTGNASLRVVERANEIIFFDARGKGTRVSKATLARIPKTREEIARKIQALKLKARAKESPQVHAYKSSVTPLQFFSDYHKQVANARGLTEGSRIVGALTKPIEKEFAALRQTSEVVPPVKKALEVLNGFFAIPENARTVQQARSGIYDRSRLKFNGITDNVASYTLRSNGAPVEIPLTAEAMRRIAAQKHEALQKALGEVKERVGEEEKVVAKKHAASEEINTLRKIVAKQKNLTPNQMAELFKYYESKR